MNRSRARTTVALIASLVIAAVTAAVALASDPSSGKLSKSSPKVEWSGSNTFGYSGYVLINSDPDAPCSQPHCDTFALEVADGPFEMVLKVALLATPAAGGAGTAVVRVTDPDGKKTVYSGDSVEDKPFVQKIKNAKSGAWTIDITDTYGGRPVEYKASAEIGGATTAPAPTTTPVPTPPPAGTPGPSEQPAATTLAVKAPSQSAKKLAKKKKFSATVSTNASVDNVNVQLLKGSKVVGKAFVAKLSGTKKVTLKVRKLKKGSYTLRATGTDTGGRAVSASASVKIKK